MALSLIMAPCLLVYRLAETGKPSLINSTDQPATQRCAGSFNAFLGIELLHLHAQGTVTTWTLRLQPLHTHILTLLGPPYQTIS